MYPVPTVPDSRPTAQGTAALLIARWRGLGLRKVIHAHHGIGTVYLLMMVGSTDWASGQEVGVL